MATTSKFFYVLNIIIDVLVILSIGFVFALLGGVIEYMGVDLLFFNKTIEAIDTIVKKINCPKEYFAIGMGIIGAYFLLSIFVLIKAFKEVGTHKVGIHIFAMLFGGILGGMCGICARDTF